MANFYFTFGTDRLFPYGINDYVMVQAATLDEACSLFKMAHPNRPGSDALNCAFFYSERSFNKFRDKFYKGRAPAEIIRLECVKGEK